MRVVLLNPCAARKLTNDGGEICYGLSILSSCLKKAGHETSLIQIVEDYSDEEILEIIRKKEPADVYAFHYLSHFRRTMERWSRLIRSATKSKIICGGSSAVIEPQTAFGIPEIDAVCIGEGENSIVEYVTALSEGRLEKGIENFWIKKSDGSLVKGSGPEVYVMEGGLKRHIPDLATFAAMGFLWGNLNNIPDSVLDSIPTGEPLPIV